MRFEDFLREWRLDFPEETVYNRGETGQWANGNYIRVRCPFCAKNPSLGPDKGHHCHVHPEWFKCQRCGTRGGINYLLGRDLLKAPPTKWNTYQVEIDSKKKQPKKLVDLFGGPASKSSPGTTVWLGDLPQSHPAWRYLLAEKFTARQIQTLLTKHPIHVCLEGKPFTDKAANSTTDRLIFTILEQGKQIGWQARWLPKSWPPTEEDSRISKEADRYITSPGLRKSFTLYNIDNALKWDTIVVVEGIKKVWKTGDFSVATFGVGNNTTPPEGLSNEDTERFWINRLIQASLAGREIWFLYDRDGLVNALTHAEAIERAGGKSSLVLLDRNQPNDVDDYCSPELLQLLLKKKGRLPKRIPLPPAPKKP